MKEHCEERHVERKEARAGLRPLHPEELAAVRGGTWDPDPTPWVIEPGPANPSTDVDNPDL